MKRSMGLLASTLLAAGLSLGGTAVVAGPAAADTGLKTVTISATSYTDNDRDDRKRGGHDWKNHKKWCENPRLLEEGTPREPLPLEVGQLLRR